MGSSFGGHEVHVDWLGRRLAHLPRRTRRRIAWTRDGREHRRGRRQDGSRWWDVIDLPFHADSVTVMLVLLASVAVLVVLSYLGVFAVLFALAELVLLVPLLAVAFAVRLLLRRPWRVTVHRAPLDVQRRDSSVMVAYEGNQKYVFPTEDCALLDIPNTTVEMLAQYLAARLRGAMRDLGVRTLTAIELEVEENFGQSATYRESPVAETADAPRGRS
jgi:hypothetical protein